MTTEKTPPSTSVHSIITRHCQVSCVSERDLPIEFRQNPLSSPYRCPRCQGSGMWRAGQEFDHMKRCGKCKIVWTPDAVCTLREVLASELVGIYGDGI